MGYELRRWLADRLPPGLSSGERLVALEIADQANDVTRLAYGRDLLEVVARRTGFSSTKQVRKVLTKLAANEIELRVPLTGKDGRPLVGADGRTVFAREGRETTYRIPTMEECPALQEPPAGVVSDVPNRGLPSGSPRNEGGAAPTPGAPADTPEGPRPGPGGPPPGDSRAPAGGREGTRWGAPSPHIPSEDPLNKSPQDQSSVLAEGEPTDRMQPAAAQAPAAQPKDSSSTPTKKRASAEPISIEAWRIVKAIPRYQSIKPWYRKPIAELADKALKAGFGREAILRYARMVIASGDFKEHHHVPEFREAMRCLERDVELGTACRVCGRPEGPQCCAQQDQAGDTGNADGAGPDPGAPDVGEINPAELEATFDRLGVPPEIREACLAAARSPTGTDG